MKTLRRLFAVMTGAAFVLASSATAGLAQTHIQPTNIPARVDGGWIYWLAFLCLALALLLVIFLIASYMRYAPRFSTDEDSAKVIRADRVVPGKDAPRRMVDVTQATPMLAQPPPVAMAAAPAPAAAPAAAPAPAAAAVPASAPAPAAAVPAIEPVPAAVAAAPAVSPQERPEVALDQGVFDATLAELLAAGTDRRIAEGKARRTAMIAARKKASGEG